MEFTIRGRVYKVFDIVRHSERFSKREIVLEVKAINERGTFIDYPKFQATQDKISQLADVEKGDIVMVKWTLTGRKWRKDGVEQFFTNAELITCNVVSKADKSDTKDEIEDQLPMGDKEYDPLGSPTLDDVIEDPNEKSELPF